MLKFMNPTGSTPRSLQIVYEVIPDLGQRLGRFTVWQEPAAPGLLAKQIPPGEIIFQEAVPLTPKNLAELAQRMENALRVQAWPDNSIWAAHLLLIEHGANVIKHGRCPPGASLAVQVRCGEEAIALFVRDRGQPWKYEEAPTVETKAQDDHGRGLMMIRRIASYIASHRAGDENVTLFAVPRNGQVPAGATACPAPTVLLSKGAY